MATSNPGPLRWTARTTKRIVRFLLVCVSLAVSGGRKYYAWLGGLTLVVVFGLYTYFIQFTEGLLITSVRNPLPWGSLPYAQFPFFDGVAAGAVVIVVVAYLYDREDFREVSIFGMAMAASMSLVAMLSVLSMLGRIDRMLNIMPIVGTPRWPMSMLPWDAMVLNAYLVINILVPGYMVYKNYYNEEVSRWLYWVLYALVPLAIIVNVIAAFIMMGTPRPTWNDAILAPRFLASSFAVASLMLILGLRVIRTQTLKLFRTDAGIGDRSLVTLGHIALIALCANLFFVGVEMFNGWYTGSHWHSLKYLFFGLEHNGHFYNGMIPLMWGSILGQLVAIGLLLLPSTRESLTWLTVASVFGGLGILFEKGLVLMISGFVPSPLGEMFEFQLLIPGVMVALALWAVFNIVYTVLIRIAIGIEVGPYDADGESPWFLRGVIQRLE